MPVDPSNCPDIVCPTDCADELPEVEFSLCAPVINFGEISKIYLTIPGNPLTNENDPAEWATRMAATDATKIIELTVLADLPAPETAQVDISGGRKATGLKSYTMALDIDETNDINYEFMCATSCATKKTLWFKTTGGKLYGGPKGIDGTLILDEVIPRSNKEVAKFTGSFKWDAKAAPCRTDSVI